METGTVQNRLFSTPASNFYEYLLVANPDENVYAKVMAEKEQFTMQYNEQTAIKTKPHITVANFLAKEEMESTMIRWTHRIISSQKKFVVTLDKFSGFPPHTIYLCVRDHEPFQQLAKELKVVDQYIKSNGCPAAKLVTRPHLTIARRLPETIYRQAESVYASKDFHASFEVKELILLRREHQFDRCRQVNVFGLQP